MSDQKEPESSDAMLVRLHAALTELDRALWDARSALNQALGRPPGDTPPRSLPLKELGALRDALDAAARPSRKTRPSIEEIAATPEPEDAPGPDRPDTEPTVGVAPSGPLRVD